MLRAISYGGGVQSTALLVLAAQGRIDFPLFLMANVGDDSESPHTLAYVRDVAAPYAADHGLELAILNRRLRDGTVETIRGRVENPRTRSIVVPAYFSEDGPPGTRTCTHDFKIRVLGKELKRRGATPANPATVGIGISLDEIRRVSSRIALNYERVVYPLIGVGEETGLKLRRDDCARIIREAGLPVPPKSSCYFCPFHRPSTWADMRRQDPESFERAATLEDSINAKREAAGKDPAYLTRLGGPLREVIPLDVPLFDVSSDGDPGCDSGWCMT